MFSTILKWQQLKRNLDFWIKEIVTKAENKGINGVVLQREYIRFAEILLSLKVYFKRKVIDICVGVWKVLKLFYFYSSSVT